MAARFAPKQREHRPLSLHTELNQEDKLREGSEVSRQPGIVMLQRYIGNSGVQRMMSASISQHATANMIHRKGCACAACSGKVEEEQPAGNSDIPVQRWWDDEESESESSDGGGSWWDSATDAVSDWVSDDDSSTTVADSHEEETEYQETDTEEEQQETESEESTDSEEGGGSWWDQATEAVSDWFSDDDESEESEPSESTDEGGGSWYEELWNEFTGGDQEDEEGAASGIGGCRTPTVGHGGGTSGGVTVDGLTSANFSHSKSYDYAEKKKYKKDDKEVKDMSITLTMTYTSSPSVSFTVVPALDTLSECKQNAVNAFTAPSGLLGKHEQEHVDKFKTYDGSETKKFTATVAADNDVAETETAAEDKATELNTAREDAARAKSDKLDPWSKPIPNIENCKDPPKTEDSE
jgi:hypothetical protein